MPELLRKGRIEGRWLFALAGCGREGVFAYQGAGHSHQRMRLPKSAFELLTHPAPTGVYTLGQIGLGSNSDSSLT